KEGAGDGAAIVEIGQEAVGPFVRGAELPVALKDGRGFGVSAEPFRSFVLVPLLVFVFFLVLPVFLVLAIVLVFRFLLGVLVQEGYRVKPDSRPDRRLSVDLAHAARENSNE